MEKKIEITDIIGRKKLLDCIGCALTTGEVTEPFGFITTTKNFRAAQDFEHPIPGFIILSSWKHVKSIDEFSKSEQREFVEFLFSLRKVMRELLDIQTIYIIQEEDTSSHFHFWLFPRYKWMEEKFGKKIESVKPIMKYSKEHMKTKENLKEIERINSRLQDYFKESRKTS